MIIKTPKKFIINRNEKILEYCKGKKILHIGACDSPFTEQRIDNNTEPLLYQEIDQVCKIQLGIDLDKNSINFLESQKGKFHNSSIKYQDMNKLADLDFTPEIIIFGEVIEHLMNLETALSTLKNIMNKDTLLIISTPNAYAFNGITANLFGKEAFHNDHKITFTYGLLKNLMIYNDIKEDNFYYCNLPYDKSKTPKLTKILDFITEKIIIKIWPQFYYNLLFIGKIK